MWLLILKEFTLEVRRKAAISALSLYLFSTTFICYLTFNLKQHLITPLVWSALFWITILFTSVSTIAKSFIGEGKARSIYYYSVARPSDIILSKIIYNSVLCASLALSGLLFFFLFLGNPVVDLQLFLVVIVLVCLGFSASLTLLSSIASRTNNGSVLMAVLSFPVVISVLLMAVKVSKNCIDGLDRSESLDEIMILASINCLVAAVSFLLFPYIWRS